MKKFIFLAGFFLLFLTIFSLKPQATSKPVIAILQTASHPALDRAREGFVEEIGDAFDVRIQNAEGLISQAQLIAKNFHRDSSVKAIFTIATPATQVMAHVEQSKPIVFSAVTDPAVLGIPATQTNITGTRDMINVQKQVALLKALTPDAKTVALMFNPGEVNSVALSSLLKDELKQHGFDWIEVGIQSEADVSIATRNACQRADVILTPTDNMVASTIQLIARVAREQRTPLIVSDNLLVEQGALASRGVDYHASGKEAAKLMQSILLEEKSPADIPIRISDNGQVVINQKSVELLGLDGAILK